MYGADNSLQYFCLTYIQCTCYHLLHFYQLLLYRDYHRYQQKSVIAYFILGLNCSLCFFFLCLRWYFQWRSVKLWLKFILSSHFQAQVRAVAGPATRCESIVTPLATEYYIFSQSKSFNNCYQQGKIINNSNDGVDMKQRQRKVHVHVGLIV